MNGPRWYVVQSQPRRESFVRERIEELGAQAFLPLIRERVPGTRRHRVAPLFPGYVFARLAEQDGDLPRLRWTHGVRRVLGDRERPRPVEDGVIDCIRARTDPHGHVRRFRRMRRGERVRIVDGPLAGLVGVLERPAADPDERVAVLLELFQRPTRVEVPAQAIGV